MPYLGYERPCINYGEKNKPADLFCTVYMERGSKYYINSKMNIIRTDMPFSPSDQWLFVKLIDRYEREIPLAPMMEGTGDNKLKYKNGRGSAWLVDYDCGSYRVQGDRVTGIRFE